MTAERERILQKIRRVQALAERGVAGEQESAAATLDRLMKQYGITEAELEEERREMEWFRYKTPIERKLLLQVIYSVTGRAAYGCVGKYTGRKRKKVGIECTAAERLEIQFDYDFFREALEEEMDRFYSAFLIKNGIFPPEGKERDELPPPREISREEALKLEALMMGMDHHTRRAALDPVAGQYDFCIIDNAPDINISTINALVASDDVIIPIKIDKYAFDGLAELKEQIEDTRDDLNPRLRLAGCLITCFIRADAEKQGEAWLRSRPEYPVFDTRIRYSEKVTESTFSEMPIAEYSRRSGTAMDYIAFVREYLNRGKE